MAITAGSEIVLTGATTVNQTTLAAVTTAAVNAGQFAVAIFSTDNTSTTDVENDDVCSGVTDTDSGSWSLIGSFCNGQAAAQSGVTVQVWLRQPGPALASGGTITFTLTNTANRDATAVSVRSFNCKAGRKILASLLTGTYTQAIDGSTLTSGAALAPTSPAGEWLRVRACACENNVATNITPTASWSAFNTARSGAGTAATECMALGEYIISSTVNESSDPTHATSADWASVYVALTDDLAVIGTAETSAINSASTHDITLPAMIEGDLCLIGIANPVGNKDVTTAGWAQIDSDINALLAIWWKVMGASPDTTATLSAPGTPGGQSVVAVAFRNSANPPQDATMTTASGTNGQPDSPSITTVTDMAIVVSFGASDNSDASVTGPTGYINQVDITADGTVANDSTLGAATIIKTTAGAEDPPGWTNFTTGIGIAWAAASVAVRPSTQAGIIFDFSRSFQHMLVR